jgi:hypothetical protein
MSAKQRLKCYINLHTTMGKLDRLLTDFHWGTVTTALDRVLPIPARGAKPPRSSTR